MRVIMVCGCVVIPGMAIDATKCKGLPGSAPGKLKHYQSLMYSCKTTKCRDYRPSDMPKTPTDWPKCLCGATAQEHG